MFLSHGNTLNSRYIYPNVFKSWKYSQLMWYLLESLEGGNGSNVQDSKRLRHHISTQNLNALSIWVPSLIYPTFPPFLVDVRHNHSYLKPNGTNISTLLLTP